MDCPECTKKENEKLIEQQANQLKEKTTELSALQKRDAVSKTCIQTVRDENENLKKTVRGKQFMLEQQELCVDAMQANLKKYSQQNVDLGIHFCYHHQIQNEIIKLKSATASIISCIFFFFCFVSR